MKAFCLGTGGGLIREAAGQEGAGEGGAPAEVEALWRDESLPPVPLWRQPVRLRVVRSFPAVKNRRSGRRRA